MYTAPHTHTRSLCLDAAPHPADHHAPLVVNVDRCCIWQQPDGGCALADLLHGVGLALDERTQVILLIIAVCRAGSVAGSIWFATADDAIAVQKNEGRKEVSSSAELI